jgi:hypothetical protein
VPQSKGDNIPMVLIVGKALPTNVVVLLKEKASLYACQAFLMENIKAKDVLLKEAKKEICDTTSIGEPQRPLTISPLVRMLSEVGEDWGWSQLSVAELNEYLEAEAYAAHIGQYIHYGGQLDVLRKELGNGISPIEWMTILDGLKSAVDVIVHPSHTSENLLAVHEDFAKLHRSYEQRVNYFKAKVKNLVTLENARIARHNADVQNETANINNKAQSAYETEYKSYSESVRTLQAEFENIRQSNIQNIASMRINVDARFQKTIDVFLNQLTDVQE